MNYIERFTSDEEIVRLATESFISIVQDESEVVFHPYIKNLEISNYYIGAPLDGIDPFLEVIHNGRKYIFYLSDSGNLSKIENTVHAISIMAQAFCNPESDYKVYSSETEAAARMVVVEGKTGKVYSSAFSQGASTKARLGLMFKKLKLIDS